MKIIFWSSLFLVFYTFAGYGIFLFLLVKIRRVLKGKRTTTFNLEKLPDCTLIIAAYNEALILDDKIKNTLSLAYPAGKLSIWIVTDGSTDHSGDIVSAYKEVRWMHSPERKGKIHAMHRAMQEVKSDIVIFTDANTFLNEDALVKMARHYADGSVGAVAGEKRVVIDAASDATAGEGFYWKYESALKKWDSELYSVVGAAGELFSIRTKLYVPVPADTVLDDFMISLHIAEKGFRIIYEPEAYAMETSSANISEELKRKIRIAAGGIQAVLRLKKMINPFHNAVLCFQYISHRVLRWTVTPYLLVVAFISNGFLAIGEHEGLYLFAFGAQCCFYLLATLGWIVEKRKLSIKILFIPYYFCMMNYAVMAGIRRYACRLAIGSMGKSKT